jgi:hypothetical protein
MRRVVLGLAWRLALDEFKCSSKQNKTPEFRSRLDSSSPAFPLAGDKFHRLFATSCLSPQRNSASGFKPSHVLCYSRCRIFADQGLCNPLQKGSDRRPIEELRVADRKHFIALPKNSKAFW